MAGIARLIMNNKIYFKEHSLNGEHTNSKSSTLTRSAHTFLVKPCYEGKAYPCHESGYDATIECPRVIRMEDMRQGIEDHTSEEFYNLRGKQPVFFLQECYPRLSAENPKPKWEWNGRLLYSVTDTDRARKVIAKHNDELQVILSFEDPDTHQYYFLIETGSKDHSEEAFRKIRREKDWELKQFFCHTIHHDLSFYCRALTESYYDIVNRDALFGPAIEEVSKVNVEEFIGEGKNEGEKVLDKDLSAFHILKSIFGRIFKIA